jgi:hypothetical protein
MSTDVSTEQFPLKHWQPHDEAQGTTPQFTALKASVSDIQYMISVCRKIAGKSENEPDCTMGTVKYVRRGDKFP